VFFAFLFFTFYFFDEGEDFRAAFELGEEVCIFGAKVIPEFQVRRFLEQSFDNLCLTPAQDGPIDVRESSA